MLKIENLKKNYGSLEVLKGINLNIEKGTVHGFLGKNGAGKTTTMNILTGLIDYNGGNVYYDDLELKKNKRVLLKKVGYCPQTPKFYDYMNAREYLSFIGSISGMSSKEIDKRSDEVLEIVGLGAAAKRRVGGYSGGMNQRFGIAAALFNKPEILFLDEPTSALDPEGRREILSLISHLKEEMTVFLSTHILNDVERVCKKVTIIDQGEILVSDTLEVLKEKYIQPIFDLEFEGEKNLSEIIRSLDFVKKVKPQGEKLSVYVSDMERAKHELLKVIASSKATLVSYEIRKPNLEDIFIRLVNENEHL